MKRKLKGFVALLAALMMFFSMGAAAADTGLERFPVRFGDRESNKIAITMDDINEPEWAWKTVELCLQHGITMTFFPIGTNLHEQDREHWQLLLDAGCEIGCHTMYHDSLPKKTDGELVWSLLHFQETLDQVLGYHYEVRWLRPPFGNLEKDDGTGMRDVMTMLKKIGYGHAILWDVSEMKSAKKALKETKNGSILLFHAREGDYNCLVDLIPMLLEAGFEPVTVSEMFGYDPPETSDEPFVYDPAVYRYPEKLKDAKEDP